MRQTLAGGIGWFLLLPAFALAQPGQLPTRQADALRQVAKGEASLTEHPQLIELLQEELAAALDGPPSEANTPLLSLLPPALPTVADWRHYYRPLFMRLDGVEVTRREGAAMVAALALRAELEGQDTPLADLGRGLRELRHEVRRQGGMTKAARRAPPNLQESSARVLRNARRELVEQAEALFAGYGDASAPAEPKSGASDALRPLSP